MVHIQWKDRYNINYKEIDSQHRVLLDILNELVDLVGQRCDSTQVSALFSRLCQYALTHFSAEEGYLKAAGYPRLSAQESEHATFVRRILELDQAYDPADPALLEETLTFLKEWYLNHILHSDLDYVAHLKRFYAEADIKAVIFDFGNVICRFDNQVFTKRLAALCGKPAGALHALIYEPPDLPRAYESGALDSAGFLAGISERCGHDFAEADVVAAYTGIFTPVEATFDLIRKLKPRVKLALISDTGPWHAEHIIRPSEVFPLFDAVTLSCELGTLKPDPRLFADALGKLGLMAEECVYVDDRRDVVQAANAFLMHGLVYTTPEALLADLRRSRVAI